MHAWQKRKLRLILLISQTREGGRTQFTPSPCPNRLLLRASPACCPSRSGRVSPAGRSSLFLLCKQEETQGPKLTPDFCEVDASACALFRLDFFLCLSSGFWSFYSFFHKTVSQESWGRTKENSGVGFCWMLWRNVVDRNYLLELVLWSKLLTS